MCTHILFSTQGIVRVGIFRCLYTKMYIHVNCRSLRCSPVLFVVCNCNGFGPDPNSKSSAIFWYAGMTALHLLFFAACYGLCCLRDSLRRRWSVAEESTTASQSLNQSVLHERTPLVLA